MGNILISLTWQEQLFAAQSGAMRRISAMNRNRSEPYKKPSLDLWGMDIESSGAECAVAKYLGRYWFFVTSRPELLDGDVGLVQVRSTPRHDGRLILHDRDKDDVPFVLVRGVMPTYELCGWILGRNGKRSEFISNGNDRPAYFVPVDVLNSMESLVACEVSL